MNQSALSWRRLEAISLAREDAQRAVRGLANGIGSHGFQRCAFESVGGEGEA